MLDECTPQLYPQNAPYRNGEIKLYLQPHTGVCSVANAMSSTDNQCYTWGDNTFWSNWALKTNTGDEATDAVDSGAPKVYSLAIANIFMSLFPILIICFHLYKPDSLSRYVTQFLTGVFMILVIIFSITAAAGANSSVLSDDQNWKLYYGQQFEYLCEGVSSSMYIGGGLAVCNIFLGAIAVIMSIIPGIVCKFITDSSGSSSSSGSRSGLDEANTNDIKASLVAGDDTQSQYVPPSV